LQQEELGKELEQEELGQEELEREEQGQNL